MDTAPAARTEAPDRAFPGERPTIGVPSIPTRTEQDPQPVPVPSIPLPADGVPLATVPSTTAGPDRRGASGADAASPTPDTDPGTAEEGSFSPGVRAKLKSYVYLLVDPRTGRPFHVGRGRDDRCFDQVWAARGARRPGESDGVGHPDPAGERGDEDMGGEEPGDNLAEDHRVLDRIRQVEASGRPVRIEILRYGLEPAEALTVEAAAHDLLGLPGDPAGGSQRQPTAEVRSRLTKRAKFKRPHQVVLLRVGPEGTDASYGTARHGWRIGRRWVDVEAPRSPHWAALVVGELVDSVYRLDGWEPAPPVTDGSAPGGTAGRTPERYSFVGTRDPELEGRYVGKSVAPYLGRVQQGSVSYVWCGPHWVNTAQ